MGVFSKYHRFREAGEEANINNVQRFGEPAVSLFTTTKVFTLHHHIDIAHIERKLLTLHQRHFITMGDGTKFEISNELFHLVKDIMNIEGLGWQIRGNIAGLNFELYDEHGEIIAVIGQKMFSIHDKYCIDIYRTEYQDTIVAVLVTLQHMIKDREAASVHSSAGGSSSSGN